MDIEKLKTQLGDLQTRRDELKAKAEAGPLSEAEASEHKTILMKQKKIVEDIEAAEVGARVDRFVAQSKVPEGVTIIPQGIKNGIRSMGEFFQAIIAAGLKDHDGEKVGRFECGRTSIDLLNHQKQWMAAASGLNEAVPSDGGFLVGTDYSGELLKESYETALLPKKCKSLKISNTSNSMELRGLDETSRATGSRYGGVQVYMKHEADSTTAKKPKFRKIKLELNKMFGLTYLTDELIQDAATLESWVREMFAEEMGFKMDDLIIRGSGSGEPLGILNAGCLRSISAESGQAADTVIAENVIKMYTFCRKKANLEWYVNEELLPQLMTMHIAVGTGGIPIWLPANNNLNGRPQDTLMGRPINYIEQASKLGDVGDIIAADFSQYLFVDKGDIQQASSIHVNFTTDETALRFTYRLDGQPLPASAKTPYKGTSGNTYSPFVALAAR